MFRPCTTVLAPLLLLLLALTSGCKKDDLSTASKAQVEAQKQTDETIIARYVQAQALTAQRTATGLYYVVQTPAPAGAPQATNGQTATVHYRGYLVNDTTNGPLFDSSYNTGRPFSFRLGAGQVIPGWDEGILLMRKGEVGRLVIPSHLGYGSSGSGTIPPNAVLVFYVSLENLQ